MDTGIAEVKKRWRFRAQIILDKIASCAEQNARCPSDTEFKKEIYEPMASKILQHMASAGVVRIEINNGNFRTVWICRGRHAGKHTALPQCNGTIRVIGPDRPVSILGEQAA